MAACSTHDARLLPPGLAALAGREAIEGFWSAGIAAGLASVRLDTVTLDVHGDRAIEVGRARVLVEPEDGEPREGVGNYLLAILLRGDHQLDDDLGSKHPDHGDATVRDGWPVHPARSSGSHRSWRSPAAPSFVGRRQVQRAPSGT